MRSRQIRRYRRGLASILIVLATSLATLLAAAPAYADTGTITGQVVDSSDNPQNNVQVNVIDPNTSATITSTTTNGSGDFSVNVTSGTYNIQFIPPTSTNLESFLATGVSTGGNSITIILKQSARRSCARIIWGQFRRRLHQQRRHEHHLQLTAQPRHERQHRRQRQLLRRTARRPERQSEHLHRD